MAISAVGQAGATAGVSGGRYSDIDRVVAVLRKTKDVNQSQAEGLVKLIEDSTKVIGRNLDVYA
jgi:hypothetical protein